MHDYDVSVRMQSDLARVEYWGTLGEWIEREDGPAEGHLARVSRTVRDAQPAIPRSARLDGPLEGFLELLTDGLVERPRPGGGVKAARSIVHSSAERTGSCEVCGDGDAAVAATNSAGGTTDGGNGAAAATAAAVGGGSAKAAARPQAAALPECDCEGCHEAAEEAKRGEARGCAQASTAAEAVAAPTAELCTAPQQHPEPTVGNGADVEPGPVAEGSAGLAAEGAEPSLEGRTGAGAEERARPHGRLARELSNGGSALSTVDLQGKRMDDSEELTGALGRLGDRRGARAHTIRSLERAVTVAPGRSASVPPLRRRTVSHYVAPPATPADKHAGVEAVPVQGHYLQVGDVVGATTPSLHAELARRSRAAASELRRESRSRSRTPNGGRRRVSV